MLGRAGHRAWLLRPRVVVASPNVVLGVVLELAEQGTESHGGTCRRTEQTNRRPLDGGCKHTARRPESGPAESFGVLDTARGCGVKVWKEPVQSSAPDQRCHSTRRPSFHTAALRQRDRHETAGAALLRRTPRTREESQMDERRTSTPFTGSGVGPRGGDRASRSAGDAP